MKKLRLRTPLVLYLCLYLSPCSATPVIQEVFYDQVGSDGSAVFTEIYGAANFSLDGWRLDAINGSNNSVYRSIDLSGAIIPTDGLLLISTTSADSVLASMSDFTANVDWQNGPDSLLLINNLGVIIDAIQYGLTSFTLRGEGIASEDVNAGFSLSRSFAGLDTNNNLIDFKKGDPTPGFAEPLKSAVLNVPVGSTTSLLFLGLLLVMVIHRKRFKQAL